MHRRGKRSPRRLLGTKRAKCDRGTKGKKIQSTQRERETPRSAFPQRGPRSGEGSTRAAGRREARGSGAPHLPEQNGAARRCGAVAALPTPHKDTRLLAEAALVRRPTEGAEVPGNGLAARTARPALRSALPCAQPCPAPQRGLRRRRQVRAWRRSQARVRRGRSRRVERFPAGRGGGGAAALGRAPAAGAGSALGGKAGRGGAGRRLDGEGCEPLCRRGLTCGCSAPLPSLSSSAPSPVSGVTLPSCPRPTLAHGRLRWNRKYRLQPGTPRR